jgi:hypothetical protein
MKFRISWLIGTIGYSVIVMLVSLIACAEKGRLFSRLRGTELIVGHMRLILFLSEFDVLT